MSLDRRTFMGVVGASAGLGLGAFTQRAQGEIHQSTLSQDPSDDHPFHFSPSDRYDQLMDDHPPALAYSGGDVWEWQARLGKKLRELVKFPPTQNRVPLNVRSIWSREHELGRIEKIVFTAEPSADVPAYVCLPKNAAPPYTWFICVQGHSTGMHNSIGVDVQDETKPISVGGDRDFGLICMRRGIAALCIEQRGFGTRRWSLNEGYGADLCKYTAMHSLMLGRTLIGERVFDVDRGIDYLMTREDVIPERIGLMGNSGGGTTTVFSAALLDRLKFAMPSCYFCTFRDSIMAIGHCQCNFVPDLLQEAEMADVLGLFAPRPVVVVAGKDDTIFPIKGVRKAFEQLKRIYAAAGAEDRCKLVVGEGGHRFYADLAWPKMLEQLKS